MGLWWRVGWRQDWWRAVVGVGLMMLLFGALYYNQQYGDSSFVWVSHALASSASAALNASLAAEQKPFSVSVHPHPLPNPSKDISSPENSSLADDSSKNSSIADDSPKKSSLDDDSSKNLAFTPTSSISDSNQQSEEVNTSDAKDQQMVMGAPYNKDYDTIDSNISASWLNKDEVSAPSPDLFIVESPSDDEATEEQLSESPEESLAPLLTPTVTMKSPEDSGNDISPSSQVQAPYWRVELELGLKDAKKAISMAPPVLADADLCPPLYHNISSFKKSYETMEQVFKIYVYEEGEKPMIQSGPLTGIYSSEGQFIARMVNGNQFTVKDHTRAHVFFLPYSVANMVDTLFVPGTHTMQPINEYIRDYVNMLAAKYPFWNASRGNDHFFVSCHDWGFLTTLGHKELNKNAIKVICNADLSDGFVLEKDASLPEIYQHSTNLPKRVGGPGPKKRHILAFFAGQMHGRVRPLLIEHWKDKDPDMKIYEVLPPSVANKMSYVKHMKSSKYCICAMGYEVNSPRLVEAIYYDCVPVIIADNFVLPFSDVIEWDSFSLTIAEREIPNLKKILMDISAKKYNTMQKRLKLVRRHFMWHEQVVRYDMFHMILHSVWMRRLRQVP